MTISNKQVYTYTVVKDLIFHKVQEYYGYNVASSLRDLEDYYTEGEIPTRIMIIDIDPNMKEIVQIFLDMLY